MDTTLREIIESSRYATSDGQPGGAVILKSDDNKDVAGITEILRQLKPVIDEIYGDTGVEREALMEERKKLGKPDFGTWAKGMGTIALLSLLGGSKGRMGETMMLASQGYGQNLARKGAADADILKMRMQDVMGKESGKRNTIAGLVTSALKNQLQPGDWVDWGYGQKMNKRTGAIAKVPTKPEKPTGGASPDEIRQAWTVEMQNVMRKLSAWATPEEAAKINNDPTAAWEALMSGRGFKEVPSEVKVSVLGELEELQGLYQPRLRENLGIGGEEAVLQGNSVVYKGKKYPLNADGTVTIDGQKYRVKR